MRIAEGAARRLRAFGIAWLGAGAIAPLLIAGASAWELPADGGTLPAAQVEEILGGNDFPEVSGFSKTLEYIDFTANGMPFTQVAIRLDPQKPRLRNGRKIVLVATEEGSSSANGFIETDEGKEGIGVWLAKRGVTFIALNRIGRWNFFAPERSGTWDKIPLPERMPIFSQHQKEYWSKDDFTSTPLRGGTSSSTGSEFARTPKPSTALYRHMLAATPGAVVDGFEAGLRRMLPAAERSQALVFYWGFSTGGAFMWPLAERLPPDGFLNWGTSPPGIAYFYESAAGGRFDWPYDKSALRVRDRGLPDFEFYNKRASAEEKAERWPRAQREPRFKAVEDSAMFFNAGALAEHAMRLYLSDVLPAEKKKQGLVKLTEEVMAPSLPGPGLKTLRVWEMNGTLDEVYPPKNVDFGREIMTGYVERMRVARIEGFNHSISNRQSRVIGTMWLRVIDAGYFDR